MSFKQNDTNNIINERNYEEYFILYIDNELNQEQMKMVDAFLIAHPDLKTEFDLLLSTRLPEEEVSFSKEDLFADAMKLNVVDEDLLLYLDNELPEYQKKKIEQQIASDNTLQLQHAILMQTKLDPSEIISYPNKEELYHRTEKAIPFRYWMRIAAAVLILAASGIVYWSTSGTMNNPLPSSVANHTIKSNPAINNTSVPQQNAIKPSSDRTENQVALAPRIPSVKKPGIKEPAPNKKYFTSHPDRQQTPVEDYIDAGMAHNNIKARLSEEAIYSEPLSETATASLNLPKSITDKPVTSSPDIRSTINSQPATTASEPEIVADRKGSLRSFLRKATRVIEKRTGINTTNDNESELLIGAVAVKLK
jgi:hypothetical protein